MILLLAALLIPSHISMCDTITKYKQLPDASVVTYQTVRDQYGCEIEQGKHKYSAAGDLDLQRFKAREAISLRHAKADPVAPFTNYQKCIAFSIDHGLKQRCDY